MAKGQHQRPVEFSLCRRGHDGHLNGADNDRDNLGGTRQRRHAGAWLIVSPWVLGFRSDLF
uniref:SPW repeat protein n=1 Tax=Mesorhizobium atlanticum TaxID=2233532 RepID=UPI003703FBBB